MRILNKCCQFLFSCYATKGQNSFQWGLWNSKRSCQSITCHKRYQFGIRKRKALERNNFTSISFQPARRGIRNARKGDFERFRWSVWKIILLKDREESRFTADKPATWRWIGGVLWEEPAGSILRHQNHEKSQGSWLDHGLQKNIRNTSGFL